MYVAGMDWETDEIIVSKFVSGVLDSSFGGDGVANFELFDEYNGGFDSVSDIEIAPNGDLVILGAAWTCAEFSNCVDAIIALRINSSGTTTGVTWGNALGSTMTNAELPLFAEIVDLGQDLNYDWADSWGAGLEVMDLEGDYFWALGGSTETDYDEVGWVLILNNSGQIDTTVGNADFADGFHVFDSSYSADGIQDTECFSWSVMNDIEWNASADRLFIIGQCDGDPIIEALHPYDNFSANLDFANAGGEPVAWVSTYSPNADFWELELRGDDLIVGGNNWENGLPGYIVLNSTPGVPWGAPGEGTPTEHFYASINEDADVDWTSINDLDVDSNGAVYIAGAIGLDRAYGNADAWMLRWNNDDTFDTTWNGGANGGQLIYGGCGEESIFTLVQYNNQWYGFGQANDPVTGTDSPFWSYQNTFALEIFAGSGTQTTAVPGNVVWTDDTIESEYVAGEAYSDAVSATYATTYHQANSFPDGVSLNTSTGAIAGTVAVDEDGNYSPYVCAKNAGGTHQWLALEMYPPQPIAPSIGSGTLDDEAPFKGTELEWVIPVSGSPTPTCEVTDGELPPGLVLDEDLCIVTGTPKIVGDYYFEITASNSVDGTSTEYSGTVDGDVEADVEAEILAEVGDLAQGAEVDLAGWGLEPDSTWEAVLRSDPVTIADGIANSFGWFNFVAALPNDIEPGEHTITVYGTDTEGNPLEAVVYITVAADGTLGYISTVEAESAGGALASTGVEGGSVNSLALFAAVMLGAGAIVARRRVTAQR
jgi:hypothetical protein